MTQVNILEAKTTLSKLVEAVESGKEREIVIARNGRPVAKLVPLAKLPVDTSKRLGIAEGKYDLPEFQDFQALDAELAKIILEGPIFPEEPVQSVKSARKQK